MGIDLGIRFDQGASEILLALLQLDILSQKFGHDRTTNNVNKTHKRF